MGLRFAAVGALTLLTVACHGDKQSLVAVSLTASPIAGDLTSVTIKIGDKTSSPFSLSPVGLTGSPRKFGVYVDGTIPAHASVLATATNATGGCAYKGTGTTENGVPASAGSTITATVTLMPDCTDGGVPDGGGDTGGTSGNSGTGGTGDGGTDGGGGGITGGGSGGAAGGVSGTGGTATGGMGTAGMGTGGAATGGTATGGRGTAGAGGGAGTGGAGTGGVSNPPTLGGCIEYDHNAANNLPCNEQTGFGDWGVDSVVFSPDGKLVVSAAQDGRIKIWKFDGKALTAEGHSFSLPRQPHVAFSPDGALLAAGDRATIAMWNVADWSARLNLSGVTGDIYGLAFTANGQSIVSVDSDKKMYLHGLTGAPIATAGPFAQTPSSLAVSPATVTTGVFAAVGFGNGDLSVYSLGASTITATPTATVHAGTDPDYYDVPAVAFSPDGKLLAVGTEDAKVQFWTFPFASNAAPSGATLILDANGNDGYQGVNGLSFSPTGRYVAVATGGLNSGGDGSIWDVTARAQLGGRAGDLLYYLISTAFSPGGGAVVFGEVACGKIALCTN